MIPQKDEKAYRETIASFQKFVGYLPGPGRAIAKMRRGQAIDSGWCAEIEEDYEKRGR